MRKLLLASGLLGSVIGGRSQGSRTPEDIANTILVTYKTECLEETKRVGIVGRSVEEAARATVSRDAKSLIGGPRLHISRSALEEDHLQVSSSFSIHFEGVREPEENGGCQVKENWLKHIGLQVISLEGSCERVAKDVLIERLANEECVQSREVDKMRYPTGEAEESRGPKEEDPLFRHQWHLNDDNAYSIQATAAWTITKGGSGSIHEQPGNTVGIVDFGFLANHPDLKGNWWVNPVERCDLNGKNGLDEDGDGFPDDCNGWNMDNRSNDLNGYSHGTKVAGCIAPVTGNSEGIKGACPNCRMLPTTVGGSVSSELAGVNYILSKGVRVVNLSVGGARSEAEFNTFKQNPHVLFVVAAGNESCDLDRINHPTNPKPCVDKYGSSAGFPAALSSDLLNVLSVGAITSGGGISSFSSIGATRVQVFAPGSYIYTTSVSSGSPGYSGRSGTSYAAPIAGAVAGLILQKYPALAACQLREALIQGCTQRVNLEGKAECNGHLNALSSLGVANAINYDQRMYSCGDASRARLEAEWGVQTPKSEDVRTPKHSAAATGSLTVAGEAQAASWEPHPEDSKILVLKKGKVPGGGPKVVAQKAPNTAVVVATPTVTPAVMAPIPPQNGMDSGERFLENILGAFAKSGILVNAGILEILVSLLLSLFSNIVDPFALMTQGVPVRKFLLNQEKESGGYLAYGDINGSARGPISLLLNPLSHAQKFLTSGRPLGYMGTPQQLPVDPFPFIGGIGNLLEPLIFGKMLVGDMMKPSGAGGGGGQVANPVPHPLDLWVLKKQMKQVKTEMLMNPMSILHGLKLYGNDPFLLNKWKPLLSVL